MNQNPLKMGGKIAIVAPAGPLEAETVFKGEEVLKEMGFDVIITPSCFERKGYLAGLSDRQRAEDIMMMFADDEVDAILCMRGGYGCNRIIPYFKNFKFETIRNHLSVIVILLTCTFSSINTII